MTGSKHTLNISLDSARTVVSGFTFLLSLLSAVDAAQLPDSAI